MGLIRNLDKTARSIDFSGINGSDSMAKGRKKVYCSDLDGIMEFNNKFLILFEVKEHGMILPMGQKLLLERLVDAWLLKPGAKAVAIYATHEPELYGAIPIEDCQVQLAYAGNHWANKGGSLLDAIINIGEVWDIKKLKQ